MEKNKKKTGMDDLNFRSFEKVIFVIELKKESEWSDVDEMTMKVP